jgi:hypothetical protein
LWLVRYVHCGKKNDIIWAFLSAAAASLTFQDGVMVALAVGGIALAMAGPNRHLFVGVTLYAIFLISYYGISIGARIAYGSWYGETFGISSGGPISALISRSGTMALDNPFDLGYFTTFAYYVSSPLAIMLLAPGLIWALFKARERERRRVWLLAAFVLPPLLAWQFLIPRFEHPVFIFPLVAIA